MDSRSRTLVREAQARDGDPVALALALVLADRLRRGDLARDRLEVAAVCGSEAACLVAGVVYSPVGFGVLVDRLPDVALLPALVAAAEAALPHVGLTQEARAAAACVLEAARAFCVAPSEAAQARWRTDEDAWMKVAHYCAVPVDSVIAPIVNVLPEVLPQGWLPLAWVCLADDPRDQVAGKRRRLARCRELGGPVVQPAVERALIAWALA